MEIANGGLPIHTDATVKIRPRIFLEGNWFVELQPGSPSAPTVSSGYTIPITQTSDPVQLDQVLDALNTDTRANLQTFLIDYGDGADAQAERRRRTPNRNPKCTALNGAQALNKTYHRGARRAARRRGPQPGDHGHRTARPLETDREHRQGHRRAERARAAARRTDRQLQHVLRSPSPRSRCRCARRSPSCRRRSRSITRGLRRARRVVRADRGVRPRHPPRRQADAVDGQGDAAVDRTGRRPRWRRTSSAASRRASRRRARRWRSCRANRSRSTSRPNCSTSA